MIEDVTNSPKDWEDFGTHLRNMVLGSITIQKAKGVTFVTSTPIHCAMLSMLWGQILSTSFQTRFQTKRLMLFTSGKSSNSNLTQKVYDFFLETYEIDSDVEVFHTNLSGDNAFGFTEVNGEEQFIQIHNKLTSRDYIITLLHELVHVVQNERGEYDDEKREKEAYELENILYTKFLKLQ